ncbi:MAG: hypothetical protein ACD_46C00327G0008 [uncultured bacterium]|nr:MAG: hypothetical protein ACD_46C00327G0008 [uncultured bacterium]
MSSEDKKKLIKKIEDHEDESGTDTGTSTGGKSGQIEFRQFISTGEKLRDDLLSPEERKRLLSIHQATHESRVEKQRKLRDERKDLKEKKIPLQAYREGLGRGMNSQYKSHPVLSRKAQFSGVDRQINTLPTENIAETNQDKRNELEYQYRLRYALENAPKFNPKPQHR